MVITKQDIKKGQHIYRYISGCQGGDIIQGWGAIYTDTSGIIQSWHFGEYLGVEDKKVYDIMWLFGANKYERGDYNINNYKMAKSVGWIADKENKPGMLYGFEKYKYEQHIYETAGRATTYKIRMLHGCGIGVRVDTTKNPKEKNEYVDYNIYGDGTTCVAVAPWTEWTEINTKTVWLFNVGSLYFYANDSVTSSQGLGRVCCGDGAINVEVNCSYKEKTATVGMLGQFEKSCGNLKIKICCPYKETTQLQLDITNMPWKVDRLEFEIESYHNIKIMDKEEWSNGFFYNREIGELILKNVTFEELKNAGHFAGATIGKIKEV